MSRTKGDENMRFNIFNKDGELIGMDYQRDNGHWSHKWFNRRDNCFERGSWRGRAEGKNQDTWKYVPVEDNAQVSEIAEVAV
jgi:hypothetical protein